MANETAEEHAKLTTAQLARRPEPTPGDAELTHGDVQPVGDWRGVILQAHVPIAVQVQNHVHTGHIHRFEYVRHKRAPCSDSRIPSMQGASIVGKREVNR